MGKHTSTWKAHERATARALGGTRVGPTGTEGADVVTEWAAVECKQRQTLPQWLKAAVQQAQGAANRGISPKLPIVVLHELGGRRVDDLVVMTLGEFKAWFGDFHGGGAT